jgi:hypothetical protein
VPKDEAAPTMIMMTIFFRVTPVSMAFMLLSEFETHKTVKARFRPWLEPFFR